MGSRAPVSSSATTSRGRRIRARASATRARSAADRDETRRPSTSSAGSPTAVRAAATSGGAVLGGRLDPVEGLLHHLAHLGLGRQDGVEVLGDEVEAAGQGQQLLAAEGGQVGPLEADRSRCRA